MKTPYRLLSPEILLSVGNLLPKKTRIKLQSANETDHLVFAQSELISQRLHHKSCSVDLIQITARDDLLMKLEMQKDRVFIFFALRGSVCFYNTAGFPISILSQNSYYISYKKKGDYFFRCPAGEHQAFILSLPYRRFKKLARSHTLLLQNISPKTSNFAVLPVVPIHREMHRWREDLYHKTDSDKKWLAEFISTVLAVYHDQAAPHLSSLPYQVKDYIMSHYTSPGLTYPSLASHFQVSERKLENDFKSEFGYTIHHYIKALRMLKAYNKIHLQKNPVSEVYYKVGYNDESSFRRLYNIHMEFVKNLHHPFKSPPY